MDVGWIALKLRGEMTPQGAMCLVKPDSGEACEKLMQLDINSALFANSQTKIVK
jgi:hypothetical protein